MSSILVTGGAGYIGSHTCVELLNQGYDVISIEEARLFNKLGLVQLTTSPMKDKDLNFFLTQLSTYIKAGITLVDAISILSKQAKSKKVKNLYN